MFLFICYNLKIKKTRRGKVYGSDISSKEYVCEVIGGGCSQMKGLIAKILDFIMPKGYLPVQIGAAIRVIISNDVVGDPVGEDLYKILTNRYGPIDMFNFNLLYNHVQPILFRLNKKLY